MFESPTESGGFGASCEREVSQTLVQHTFPGGRYPKRNIGKVPGHYRSRNAKETRRNTNTIPRKVRQYKQSRALDVSKYVAFPISLPMSPQNSFFPLPSFDWNTNAVFGFFSGF